MFIDVEAPDEKSAEESMLVDIIAKARNDGLALTIWLDDERAPQSQAGKP